MASFESVSVNYGDMSNTASQFNTKVSELEQTLSQIQNMIQQVGGTWSGQGYTSFTTIMADWHKNVKELNHTLSLISANVNKSSTAYSDTDTSVGRSFHGL